MAIAIVIILLPELKTNIKHTFPAIEWGTGFGSSLSALLLLGASFVTNRIKWFRDPEPDSTAVPAGRQGCQPGRTGCQE